MNLKDKSVLVVGLATTGIPLVEVLRDLGANVTVTDTKSLTDLSEPICALKLEPSKNYFGIQLKTIEDAGDPDFIVLSPGVPLSIPLIVDARKKGVEVLGEIELAYRLTKGKIIGITGTNGKTTTTALTGEIFKRHSTKTHVVGNIGVPMISKALGSTDDDYFIVELSSFQLESIKEFKAVAGTILNITPDHLNRHKTMERYIDCKLKIFNRQGTEDFGIINLDDPISLKATGNLKHKKIFFSRKQMVDHGVMVDKGRIVIKNEGQTHSVIEKNELQILGEHNVENALAATALAWAMGVNIENIREGLRNFKGVAHRIEVLGELNGITFINDSKGTNPDASIKAIEAVDAPIILIAGGMDKNSDYDQWTSLFQGRVRKVLLFGETAEIIEKSCHKNDFYETEIHSNLDDAVKKGYSLGEEGDVVMLSPASASWDMYTSYEVRGDHFRSLFESLKEEA